MDDRHRRASAGYRTRLTGDSSVAHRDDQGVVTGGDGSGGRSVVPVVPLVGAGVVAADSDSDGGGAVVPVDDVPAVDVREPDGRCGEPDGFGDEPAEWLREMLGAVFAGWYGLLPPPELPDGVGRTTK